MQMLDLNISERTRRQLLAELFDQPLIQNNLRGVWMEYVVAEALGANFKLVSQDWHAWDIEWGVAAAVYPDRIRIQVKNTARTQTWGKHLGIYTDCMWSIALRNRPSYFEKYNPGIPCEQYGFHCEIFVLCHHPEEDWQKADHRDLEQWNFYVLPVTRDHCVYPIHAIDPNVRQKKKTFSVVPRSLESGIRNRPGVKPVKLPGLNEAHIRDCLQRWRLNT
jgi:hypothetical protein